MNVLKIAKAHKKEIMKTPAARILVDEWIDPDTNKPVQLLVKRLSATEVSEIVAARRSGGEIGAMIMTIIKVCHEDTAEQRRAFADTDVQDLMQHVDEGILKRIYTQIIDALPELGAI